MKKIVLLIIAIFLITGCGKQEKFYLNDKYYHNGEYIKVTSNELDNIKDESMVIYTYNNFCNLPIQCETVFKEIMEKNKIDFISIPFSEFKNTKFYHDVSYAPSIIIVNDGKIVSYLKADSNQDYDKYQKASEFEKWLSEYVYLDKNNV